MLAPRRQSMFLYGVALIAVVGLGAVRGTAGAPAQAPAAARGDVELTLDAADCSAEKVGTMIPTDRIGEPVRRVTLASPVWAEATANAPAYCRVDGVIEAVEAADEDWFCIGVQWQPQSESASALDMQLFESFVQACTRQVEKLKLAA